MQRRVLRLSLSLWLLLSAASCLVIPTAANALSIAGPTSHLWGSQSQPQYYWGFDYSTYAEITSVDHERNTFRIEITGDGYVPLCCSTTPGDRWARFASVGLIFSAIGPSLLELELIEVRGIALTSSRDSRIWAMIGGGFGSAENVSWYLSFEVTQLDPSVYYDLQFVVGHEGGFVGGSGGGGGTVITPDWVFTVSDPIPEPSTALLVMTGLLGLAGWRRRRV